MKLRSGARLPHAWWLGFALAVGLAVAATGGGCAKKGSSVPGSSAGNGQTFVAAADDGGEVFTGDCPADLQSIRITPASSSTEVTYPATPAAVSFKAEGTFAGGATMDITGCVAWTLSPGVGSVMGGTFSPTGGGVFTITAMDGSISATATVTVKVTGAANAAGIDTTKLDAAPSGAAPTVAYPLDGALFPYHFGDLAFQVVPSAQGQTIARVHFEGDAIDLNVYAPCTPIPSAAASEACSIVLPADLEADPRGRERRREPEGDRAPRRGRRLAPRGEPVARRAGGPTRPSPGPSTTGARLRTEIRARARLSG